MNDCLSANHLKQPSDTQQDMSATSVLELEAMQHTDAQRSRGGNLSLGNSLQGSAVLVRSFAVETIELDIKLGCNPPPPVNAQTAKVVPRGGDVELTRHDLLWIHQVALTDVETVVTLLVVLHVDEYKKTSE